MRGGSLGVARLERLPPAAFEVLHENLARAGFLDGLALLSLLFGDGAVDGASEAHAQVDADAVLDRGVHHGLVVVEFEVCEEAQGAECKGQHGGHDPLEEPGCEEDGAIAAELERRGKDVC